MKIIRKLSSLKALYNDFGPRWIVFRIGYALRMRTGLIRWQIPAYQWQDRPLRDWMKDEIPFDPQEYFQWRKENEPNFFFDQISTIPKKFKWKESKVIKEADQYLSGITRYFSKTDFQIGFPPDWHLDPLKNIHLPHNKHWSQIPDDGEFDIKYVWEASRFSQIFTLVRAYAHKQDDHYPAAFWIIIEDWMEKNPPNCGPNWKDGQEAALRLMALSFGYYAFRNHSETTSERVSKLTLLVASLAERIYKNIEYAIFTRSNHTISEGFGLWLAGTLFPELKNANKYQKNGKKILEKEAARQIYPDGSYSMHSLNYHRFVLHLFIYALQIDELNKAELSDAVYQAVERSIECLYHLIDLETGKMPQYGSNDGALILPLNSCDFSDYRPVIQAGYYLLHGNRIFPAGVWDEDLFWLFGVEALSDVRKPKKQLKDHIFLDGGISKISGEDSHVFIRCGQLRDRPSHADQNHVDLWWHGKNIALDAGTYLYNGDGLWNNGLASTNIHNTISVDYEDQMVKFSRFIWVNWSQGNILAHDEKNGIKFWQGQHNGYARLSDPVMHKRSVILLNGHSWLIVDHVSGQKDHEFTLNWLLDPDFSTVEEQENTLKLEYQPKTIKAYFGTVGKQLPISTVRADLDSTRGWISPYYGYKEPALSVQLNDRNSQMIFWTLFSDEEILLKQSEEMITIDAADYTINLDNKIISIMQPDQNDAFQINPLVE